MCIRDRYYTLWTQIGGANKVIDIAGGSSENSANVQVWGSSNGSHQQFKLKNNGDGSYSILTKVSSDTKCLDVSGRSKDDGANVLHLSLIHISIFNKYPIVCEAFDNPDNKAMLVNNLLEKLEGVKVVSSSGMAGYESSNLIKTRKVMKNFYLCGDGVTDAYSGIGLMAGRVNICAGHASNMVIRLILGIEEI